MTRFSQLSAQFPPFFPNSCGFSTVENSNIRLQFDFISCAFLKYQCAFKSNSFAYFHILPNNLWRADKTVPNFCHIHASRSRPRPRKESPFLNSRPCSAPAAASPQKFANEARQPASIPFQADENSGKKGFPSFPEECPNDIARHPKRLRRKPVDGGGTGRPSVLSFDRKTWPSRDNPAKWL